MKSKAIEILESEPIFIDEAEGIQFLFFPSVNSSKCGVLLTDGIRNFEMPVPKGVQLSGQCELLFVFPDYWPKDFNTSSNENYNWPLHWMKKIATLPKKKNTWFGEGHSFPAKKLAPITHQSAFILSRPKKMTLIKNLSEALEFPLYTIIPITEKELQYKLKLGAPKFLEKYFNRHNEIVDLQREEVNLKKWGIF